MAAKRIVQLPVEIDPEFIKEISTTSTVFGQVYSGSWAYGVANTKARGWLLFEEGAVDEYGADLDHTVALRAWKRGEELPAHYHRLDEAMAIKMYMEGVKSWGLAWLERADGNWFDWALQQAMFGQQRYN